jgi:DNA-binding transcriptional LysR family regulator
VLAASWEADLDEIAKDYVFVDWGPEFVQAHTLELAEMTNPGLTLSLGTMAAEYIVNRHAAAYLPARYIKKYLDEGRLHLVPNAPRFPYPVWSIWRDDLDEDLRSVAHEALVIIKSQIEADQDAVISELAEISQVDTVEVLGNMDVD